MDEENFCSANYVVCYYCANTVLGVHRDGYDQGCKLVTNDEGKFAKVVFPYMVDGLKAKGVDCFNMETGCEKFEPNGLSAHPIVLEALVKRNSKCEKIPSDSRTKDRDFRGFEDELMKILPLTSMINYE